MTASRTKSVKKTDPADTDFVLKHRIAGAAFLLFFGALILPYLLGAPADSQQLEQQRQAVNNSRESNAPPASSAEEVLLAAIESEVDRPEEQVYISKITPLDGESDSPGASSGLSAASPESSLDDQELAMLEQLDRQQNQAPDLSQQTAVTSANKTSAATAEEKQESETPKPRASESTPSSTAAAASTEAADPVTATVSKPSIDVGWIVQVGVFTDKKGAARVVQDLRSKGFVPSTTIVDTNRGKATGTRIWLGPYEQRVEAAKAKSLLTSKTGEAGFIRAYP